MQFYTYLAYTWVGLSIITFIALLKISAPYGKFSRPGFGPIIGRTTGWVLMELPAFLAVPFFFFIGNRQDNPVAIVFVSLWVVHYSYRTFIFPFRMRGQKKSIALVPVLLGVVFNLGNGYLNGGYLFTFAPVRDVDWMLGARFVIGAVLFFSGLIIHIQSDGILRSLRTEGESEYKIPRGGMFRYVSAANYFGEIVEWAGFALLTWSPGGLVFVIWTTANLLPRALSSHKWYREKFADYPKKRKAIIPFIL